MFDNYNSDNIALRSLNDKLSYNEIIQETKNLNDKIDLNYDVYALFLSNSLAWPLFDIFLFNENKLCVPIPKFFTNNFVLKFLDFSNAQIIISDNFDFFIENYDFYSLKLVLIESFIIKGEEIFVFKSRYAFHKLKNSKEISKITFTSGTTSSPKGVCLSKSYIEKTANNLAEKLHKLDHKVHLSILPYTVLLENIAGIYVSLLLKKTIHIENQDYLAFDGVKFKSKEKFIDIVERIEPDSVICYPQLLELFIKLYKKNKKIFSTNNFIAMGGAPSSQKDIYIAKKLGINVYEGYGLSECSSVVSLNTPFEYKKNTQGKILTHNSYKIFNNELYIKNLGFLGYIKEDINYFKKNTNKWIPTGDIVKVDNNNFLKVVGRKKDLIINSYGRNINAKEIEDKLLATNIFKELLLVGNNKNYCTLFYVPLHNDMDIKEFISNINKKLPDFSKIKIYIKVQKFPSQKKLDQDRGNYRFFYEKNYVNKKNISNKIGVKNVL